MEIIIKISTLYGISFLIAMFVAFIIWVLYEIISNPGMVNRLSGAFKKSNALDESNKKVD